MPGEKAGQIKGLSLTMGLRQLGENFPTSNGLKLLARNH
jgi:hypothetical protein